jgi:hypothetical protein
MEYDPQEWGYLTQDETLRLEIRLKRLVSGRLKKSILVDLGGLSWGRSGDFF